MAVASAHHVVPSVPLAVCALVARVSCFRLASVGPFVVPALVPALPPQASASPGSNGYAAALGRPLSLGRAAGVALVRRVSSSARRGRRIASADFHSTGVACGGRLPLFLSSKIVAADAGSISIIRLVAGGFAKYWQICSRALSIFADITNSPFESVVQENAMYYNCTFVVHFMYAVCRSDWRTDGLAKRRIPGTES